MPTTGGFEQGITARRFLWFSLSGLFIKLVLVLAIVGVALYVFVVVSQGLTLSEHLNEQANRTTTMRQAASDYVANPTAELLLATFNTDYLAWRQGHEDLTQDAAGWGADLQTSFAQTEGPQTGIMLGVEILSADPRGDQARLNADYITLVVSVGQYNIQMNAIAATVLTGNVTRVGAAIQTCSVLGVLAVVVFAVEGLISIRPAYQTLATARLNNGQKKEEEVPSA